MATSTASTPQQYHRTEFQSLNNRLYETHWDGPEPSKRGAVAVPYIFQPDPVTEKDDAALRNHGT